VRSATRTLALACVSVVLVPAGMIGGGVIGHEHAKHKNEVTHFAFVKAGREAIDTSVGVGLGGMITTGAVGFGWGRRSRRSGQLRSDRRDTQVSR
jgi:hypothetical protein